MPKGEQKATQPSPTPDKPQKLMVTNTVRVSTESGVLIFEQGKTFGDPALVGMIIQHKIPHFKMSEDVPDEALPTSAAPATHA